MPTITVPKPSLSPDQQPSEEIPQDSPDTEDFLEKEPIVSSEEIETLCRTAYAGMESVTAGFKVQLLGSYTISAQP